MKEFASLEDSLLDSADIMKKASKTLIYNMGKVIAVLVFILMIAVTFTDVSFGGIFTEEFASALALLITSSYIIYFSLEDAGEKHGEDTSEFKKSRERYDSLREKITGSDIEKLRVFCIEYSTRELEYRKKNYLLSKGLCEKDLESYRQGGIFDKKTVSVFKKIDKIKPVILTPKILLCRDKASRRSELENPEKRKLPMLILKLIPSTLCMTVTLSVMLTAKEGLTPTDVLNGILKLSALPLIGFKGYSAGYSYVKHSISLYTETKANILEDFLKEAKDFSD